MSIVLGGIEIIIVGFLMGVGAKGAFLAFGLAGL